MIQAVGVGGVRMFEARQRVGIQAAGFIAGGVLFLLMLIVQFLLALGRKSTPTTDMMPGIIGGLSVFGIALIGRGIFLLRGVTRVVLDDGGVHVEGFIARRSVSYQQIERIERDKRTQLLAGKTNDVLLLRAAGETKSLAIIPDTIDNFEQLAVELAARSAAAQGGRTTYDPVADQQLHQTRESRQLKLASVLMSIFTLLFFGAFCYGVYEEVHERRLTRDGTMVDARISQRFMRRVTPYIAYTFRDQQGRAHSREVMVTQEMYDTTEGAQTVPVVYLPDKPQWNRPAAGDASKGFGGAKSLLLFGGATLMFGVFAVITLLGIDIKSENGRMRIVKRGKVIREFGGRAAPRPPALPPLPQFDETPPTLAADEDDEEEGEPATVDAAYPAYPSAALMPPPPPQAIFAAPAKPKGLLVLGVLCIVFGVPGILLGIANWGIDSASRTREVSIGDQVMVVEQPTFAAYWALADATLAAALVVTGVGLLMLKRWSRPLGISVAALQILSSLAGAILVIATMAKAPAADGPDSLTIVTFNVAAVVIKFLTMIFPAVLLFILAKRSTAEALNERVP
jgi:hypothetical protein